MSHLEHLKASKIGYHTPVQGKSMQDMFGIGTKVLGIWSMSVLFLICRTLKLTILTIAASFVAERCPRYLKTCNIGRRLSRVNGSEEAPYSYRLSFADRFKCFHPSPRSLETLSDLTHQRTKNVGKGN